jgi:hypothetical protein
LNNLSEFRLNEIKEKYERLIKTDEENRELILQLNTILSEIATIQDEPYITKKSKGRFVDILSEKSLLESESKKEKRNPFKIQKEIEELTLRSTVLKDQIARNKQSYEYFLRYLETIRKLLTSLESEAYEAKHDNYPDSAKAKDVFNRLTPLYKKDFETLNIK